MTLAQRIAQVLADMSIVAEASAGPAMDSSGGNTKPGSRPPRSSGPPLHDEYYGCFERLLWIAELELVRAKGQDTFAGPLRAEERNERIVKALKGVDPTKAAVIARVSENHVRTIRRNAGCDVYGYEIAKRKEAA